MSRATAAVLLAVLLALAGATFLLTDRDDDEVLTRSLTPGDRDADPAARRARREEVEEGVDIETRPESSAAGEVVHPLILSGRVIDETGAPVPDVRLLFGPRRTQDPREGPAESAADGEGRFELRGSWIEPGARVTAIVVAEDLVAQFEEFEAGAVDAVIRVQRAGIVVVPVRVPRGMRHGAMVATLLADGDSTAFSRAMFEAGEIDRRIEAVFAQIPPGRYEARIVGGGPPRSAGTVDVAPASRVETPVVDLAAEFRVIEVHAVTPDGAAASVFVAADCDGVTVRARGSGRTLVVPHGPCTLRIEPMRRYRHVVIHDPPDTVRVTLRPRIPVDIAAAVSLPEGAHLLVSLGREAGGGRLDEDARSVRVHLPSPGRHPITVTLRSPRYGERIASLVTGETRREIVGYHEHVVSPEGATLEVRDLDGGQSATAPIDPERLAAAVASLGD